MQEMVHAIIDTIAIVELIASVTRPLVGKKTIKGYRTNHVNRFVFYVDVCKEKAKINIPDGRNYEPQYIFTEKNTV